MLTYAIGSQIDADGSGSIEFPEFLEMMTGKMGEKDTKEEILKVFKLFDDDSTGKISFKNLKRVAKELGENMTEEELQDMIDQADRDGDGEINPDEFYRIMKKRGDNPLDDLLEVRAPPPSPLICDPCALSDDRPPIGPGITLHLLALASPLFLRPRCLARFAGRRRLECSISRACRQCV